MFIFDRNRLERNNSESQVPHGGILSDFPLILLCVNQDPIQRHRHEYIEVVYVLSGLAEHVRGAAEGEEIRMVIRPGDLFAVLPGEYHAYEKIRELKLYNLLFSPELIGIRIHELSGLGGLKALWGEMHGKIQLPLHVRPEFERICEAIRRELSLQPPCYRLNAEALLAELLVLIGRQEPSREADSPKHDAISRSILYMEQHLSDPMDLTTIAAQAGMHLSQFCKIFKQATGITPWNYRNFLRLEKAKVLLLSSDLGISEIACRLGFCAASHFTKQFVRFEGITPRDFRKKNMWSPERFSRICMGTSQ